MIRLALFDQAAKPTEVDAVEISAPIVFSLGRFQNFGRVGEPGVVDEIGEALAAETSLTYVLMTIQSTSAGALRVVDVDASDLVEADVLLQFRNGPAVFRGVGEVVAGGKQVARVEANGQPLVFGYAGDDSAEVFDFMPNRIALTGGRFEQDLGRKAARRAVDGVERCNDSLDSGVESLTHVRAGVQYE